MKNILVLLAFILLQLNVKAQNTFSIGGTIKNAKGELLDGATVFIAGSQKAMATNAGGKFMFSSIAPGTYQVIINMLGYTSFKQPVIVKDKAEVIDLTLQPKDIALNVVSIGGNKKQNDYLKTFVKYFMGESANAKSCKILNPEILDFATYKSELNASTSDFLIIENKNLGYRVKYLLKNFSYNEDKKVTLYDGDSVFEPLEATPEQQAKWNENRRKAYYGSLKHYLRALCANTTRKEGFITYAVVGAYSFPLVVSPNAVYTEQLIKRVDSNFVDFTFKTKLYIVYDKKKALKEEEFIVDSRQKMIGEIEDNGSIFMLHGQVDRRGSYADADKLLIQGAWGRQRIGDQLPLEYDPG